MNRVIRWFELEGETPGERIRQNPIKLLILVIGLWITTVIAYFSFSQFMGELWATIVILLGAVAVAFHLRDLLVSSQTDDE